MSQIHVQGHVHVPPSRRLSRRRFLGGAAVSIGLPAFESLLGGRAYAAAAADRKRLVTVFAPNGMYLPDWKPADKQTGPLDVTPALLKPLAAVKNKVLVLHNVTNGPGDPDGAGDHAAGAGAAFTCVAVARADGAGICAGISVDQVAAGQLKAFTRVPSLQLGVIPGKPSGNEAGYGFVYENTMAWAGEKEPLAPVHSPAAAFQNLFAGFDPSESEAARVARLARRQSVLDYVREEAGVLRGKLGRSDGTKLEQLLTGIRDIERKLQPAAGAPAGGGQCGMARPADPDDKDYNARSKLMNDIIVSAFQCDLTRVVSHVIAPPYPNINYGFMGVATGHHSISHFKSATAIEQYRQICSWHMQQTADLLVKLDAVREDAGTLLDRTIVIQSSDCGRSNAHDHYDLPVVVAGGAGVLKMGRQIFYPPRTVPLANVFISALGALGVPATRFGKDGTGPAPDLA